MFEFVQQDIYQTDVANISVPLTLLETVKQRRSQYVNTLLIFKMQIKGELELLT